MSINRPEQGDSHLPIDKVKGFLREVRREIAFLRMDWELDYKPELISIAGDFKFNLIHRLTRGGKRFNHIYDLTPEDRWTSETLRNTEEWVYNQTNNRRRAIASAYSVWILNSFYIKERYGVTKDLAVSGKPSEEGVTQLIIRHPELLAEDPIATAKMVCDFQLYISGRAPKVQEDIVVKPLYIGDGVPTLDFSDKAVETSKKEGEQFLGIYQDNLLADLEHTFDRRMLSALIDTRSSFTAVPLRGLIGTRGDNGLRNMLTHMWAGEPI